MTKEDIITKSMHFSNVSLLDAEVFFSVQNSIVDQADSQFYQAN